MRGSYRSNISKVARNRSRDRQSHKTGKVLAEAVVGEEFVLVEVNPVNITNMFSNKGHGILRRKFTLVRCKINWFCFKDVALCQLRVGQSNVSGSKKNAQTQTRRVLSIQQKEC